MPEEPETPPSGQEPGADEPRETPQLPQEQPEIPPETPPETPPKQLSEEDILHRTQSWTGRRLAEMKDEILGAMREMIPANAPATPAPDPSVDADAWFEHKLGEKVKQEQKYNNELYKVGMGLIDADPLVQTDTALKDEILAEVQSGRAPINRQLDPANAAQVALAFAKANVLSRRLAQPKNPLDGNAPSSVPKGGVTPPETPPKPAVKLPEMSPYAKRMAKAWGYTDEQIAEVLNESK